MTATEMLRRLLDERGVEYGTGFGGDTLWTGRHGIEWRWDAQEGKLAMFTHDITPEQAIEATLGRGTCHSDNNPPLLYDDPFRVFRCSECHHKVDLRYNHKPNYCPNCGRKVVDA